MWICYLFVLVSDLEAGFLIYLLLEVGRGHLVGLIIIIDGQLLIL